MNKKLIIMLCLFLMGLAGSAWGMSQEWKLVIRVKGIVESQFSGETRWQRIIRSRMLQDGDKTKTGQESTAKIRLADNSTVTVGENTEVEVSRFQLQETSRIVDIKVKYGRIRSSVGKQEGKQTEFKVRTPNAVMAARGTEFFTHYQPPSNEDSDRGTTLLMVFSDSVDFISGDKTVTVYEGNTAMVGPDGIIHLNPPGFLFTSSSAASTPEGADSGTPDSPVPPHDAFLTQPDVLAQQNIYNTVPGDPMSPGTQPGFASGGGGDGGSPDAGVIVPSPGNTGSITVIVNPR